MLANFTLTQWVHLCLQNSTQDMSLMWIWKDLSPVSTNVEVSEIKFHRIFNEWDRIEKLRAFTQHELRKRLTVAIQLGSCGHCNTMFEAMGSFYQYCPCQGACPVLIEERIQSGTIKRKLDEARKQYIEKFTLLSICVNVNGGNSTRLMCRYRKDWENHSHTSSQWVRTGYWKNEISRIFWVR